MWSKTIYFFEKALGHFRQSLGSNLLALVTVAAALFLFFAYLLGADNLDRNLDGWRSRMNISIFLYDENAESPESRSELRQMLSSLEGVSEVTFYDKAKALALYREDLQGQAGLLDQLETNPLPAYFVLRLLPDYQTPQQVSRIAQEVLAWEEIEEVGYGEEWLETVASFVDLIRWIGLLLGGMLLLAILFIVFNTIRLALWSRKEEIEIMQLVGATSRFIKIPFLIEGTLQTLLSCAVALLALWLLHIGWLDTRMETLGGQLGGFQWSFLSGRVMGMGLLGSMVAGFMGSWFSVQKFLDY